jgi:hypothetical protein
MADNAASSDLGEWADDFPTVSSEAKQELEDILDAWPARTAPARSTASKTSRRS